jgi:hypothetical protein
MMQCSNWWRLGTGKSRVSKGSGSFLKKRTKKLLHGCRGLVGDSRAKVFASFVKKKSFLASGTAP